MTPEERRRRAVWPALLFEISIAVSPAAALRLADTLGGQRIYIPQIAKGSKLERQVGAEIAAHLAETHAGEMLVIPSFGAREAHERRQFVLQNPERSINDLARALGVSSRRIEQIRSEARDDPRQLDLF
ncbi:MAG: hypothetical protein AAF568_03420 [Pseudomonadota bacterium]